MNISGKNLLGFEKIHIMNPAVTVPTTTPATNNTSVTLLISSKEVEQPVVITAYYSPLTTMEVITLSTGQGNPKVWLEWPVNE